MFENSFARASEYRTDLRRFCVSETKEEVNNRKTVCTEVLHILEPIMAHSIPYELCRNEKVFMILFHGQEKQYLQVCVQALRKAIPFVTRETQVKLIELQELIQNYLHSLAHTVAVKNLEACTDLFERNLEKQRLCLQQSYCEKTRKKWYRHCRRYLEDLAFIKSVFDTIVLLLHAEISQR